MANVSADLKAAILTELNQDGDAILGSLVEVYWDLYAEKDLIRPPLRSLYCKRALLGVLMARTAPDVTASVGDANESASDVYKHWSELRETLDAEIKELEALARTSGRPPALGAMTATAPQGVGRIPDPNDPAYRGSPLVRTGWRQ